MVSHGHDASFGFTVIAILNAGSFFGRWLPGLAADMIGRFNVLIISAALCALTILAIWIPTGSSTALTVVFAALFGFTSGNNLGLIPVCISQLCTVEDYGRYLSTAYFAASFG